MTDEVPAEVMAVIDLAGQRDISDTLAAGHWALMDGRDTHSRVAEIITRDPADRYPADLIRECGPDTRPGDLWDGKAFVHPPAPPPAARIVSGPAFRALFTPAELAAMWAADPRLMAAAMDVLAQNSANLDSPGLAAMLDLAVAKGALAPARPARVIAGQPPA